MSTEALTKAQEISWCRCGNAGMFIVMDEAKGYGHVICSVCDMRTGGKVAREVAIADWNRFQDGPDRRAALATKENSDAG